MSASGPLAFLLRGAVWHDTERLSDCCLHMSNNAFTPQVTVEVPTSKSRLGGAKAFAGIAYEGTRPLCAAAPQTVYLMQLTPCLVQHVAVVIKPALVSRQHMRQTHGRCALLVRAATLPSYPPRLPT